MRLPNQSAPVDRGNSFAIANSDGVLPSNCVGIPNNILGRCFVNNGAPIENTNCAACCPRRDSVGWAAYLPNMQVAVCP